MPVKNTAPYLHDCLNSILHQTYSNWELIAVDDASDDNSLLILQKYALIDQRIRVVPNNGKGVIDALKTAYAHAKGEYISRMDSDDINALQKFEQMYQQLSEAGKGHIALGQVEYFAEEGLGEGYLQYQLWLNELIFQGSGFSEVYKECVIPSPCWLLHREDLDACGAFKSTFFPEDYDLCFRMYKAGLHCIPAAQVLLKWRDRPLRTTRIDKNYKAEKLLWLKCHYFLDIDYHSEKQLVLWGAGKRGKFIARFLNERDIQFSWVCNNEKKIGKMIYKNQLKSTHKLEDIKDKQIIISVANPAEQQEIRSICNLNNWERYFFC